jgi:hypothetical protein
MYFLRSAVAVAFLAALPTVATAQADLPLDRIRLPPGFAIDVVARVDAARAMTWGDKGTLFVGTHRGRVFAVTLPAPGTTGPARVRTIASGLRDPSGVAFRDGALYVSAVSRILRFDDIERRLDDPPAPVVVTDRYPGDAHHGRKFIAFGPDGKLYVPIGAPCNICEATADRHSVITRINPDGSGYEVVARGVRNTVGFDFHPVTKEMWFTDNGRDWLGDDRPPCELNRLQKAGQHFGFPYCHGSDVVDPDYGGKRACSEFEAPVQSLGAHVAPLGMRFYTGTQFPAAYRGQAFIAEHGSWNRSRKIGYRVMLVRLDANGKALAYEPFAQGWLEGERAWGRPADVSVGPDGSLFVSDDGSGTVYRIRYRGA